MWNAKLLWAKNMPSNDKESSREFVVCLLLRALVSRLGATCVCIFVWGTVKFAVPFHFFLCCESRAQKGHSTCVMWINVLSKMGLESLTKECVVFSQGWHRVVSAMQLTVIAMGPSPWGPERSPLQVRHGLLGWLIVWVKYSRHKMHIAIIDRSRASRVLRGSLTSIQDKWKETADEIRFNETKWNTSHMSLFSVAGIQSKGVWGMRRSLKCFAISAHKESLPLFLKRQGTERHGVGTGYHLDWPLPGLKLMERGVAGIFELYWRFMNCQRLYYIRSIIVLYRNSSWFIVI